MNLLYYVGAFALALGLLIVVHEFGHYLVARWCGVKVLRFSVGFGRPLLSRRMGRDGTEWALAAFPLGGYVKFLDEREGEVPAAELPCAFNRQPVGKRFVIVAAGPVANFLLAIVLYWALLVQGTEELRPFLGTPAPQSSAASAGFADGELVRSVDGKPIATWQDFRWEMLHHALDRSTITIETSSADGNINVRRLDLSGLDSEDLDGDFLQRLGFRPYRPRIPAVIGSVIAGGAGEAAGLKSGDRIAGVDGKPVRDWGEFVARVRESPAKTLMFSVEREGRLFDLPVTPAAAEEGGKPVGRIGVGVRNPELDRSLLFTTVRFGPLEAVGRAVRQTWETSAFSLSALGRMVTGEISWRNLSGPVTIADYAGQSAKLGLAHYLKFLALISISLGVLNLLPIPLLDGGHLMYYIVEIVKGGPVSERVMEIGQQIGLALLIMLMAFAFYNDINRLISS
ncbi:MAG: RIP metalloprotease RseP [Pseudomonadota bacterium]|jgi:regulator of sigma E protease